MGKRYCPHRLDSRLPLVLPREIRPTTGRPTCKRPNVKKTIANLPAWQNFEGYDGLVADDGVSTTMPPIILNVSVDSYIRAARSILNMTKEFIEYRIGSNTPTKVMLTITFLAYKTMSAGSCGQQTMFQSTAVRALMEWKHSVSSDSGTTRILLLGAVLQMQPV